MRNAYPLALAALFGAALLPAPPAAAQERPTLTVYTYSSFVGRYGPGEAIAERFEASCGCDLEWVTADDAGSLLGRLRLEGESTTADVVLGHDMNLAGEARDLGLFAPHGVETGELDMPVAWDDETFLPYDWGYLAFVYDTTRLDSPPESLEALFTDAAGPSVVLQDPRTSAPGFGLLLWSSAVFGEGMADAWEALTPRVVTFTTGWSEAYGLFLEGEADMVLSYSTSPAYHRAVEDETRYEAARFAEGHYLHVEIAGMTTTTDVPDLARDFLAFMLEEDFQSLIPEGNWMYPANLPSSGLPESFEGLIEPGEAFLFDAERVSAERRALIDTWLEATTR
ncbi:thiamine ABC transporter substrate binding subunit [Salinarimonas ramus]|uniref:Thiamine-binding periplasmic protein n=1 Tax=Salinarimonas ramus TaxID=690164 RepID=A0A917Q9J5_9HYPH|nr:thiamine ABC transporter substrate binding subunit [Salinarimonas ramus]GGK36353.1 thiamine transporter substrate binding subunit [Salinarimonas ramus]